jgi:hypothetical protein
MADAHKNFAYSLVATAPNPADTGTSLIVTAGQGALFPAVPFNATIWPTNVQPISTNAEIVTVTAINVDTFTIVRAQEGTIARSVIIGDQIAATLTVRTMNDAEGNLQPSTDQQIQANFSTIVAGRYVVASGKRLTIKSGGRLKVI